MRRFVPIFHWLDVAALGTLALTAVVLCVPVFQSGWLTYIDNPAHVAEIQSLAGEGWCGWSPIAFAGLSLDALHSPLLWRGLALLVHLGAPIHALYAACIGLAVLAPALALFAVARRRTGTLPAVFLAWLLLIQRPSIVGVSSATGGMWTFYLASAALILLADRLARADTSRRNSAAIAALLGLIGLTHLFVLVAAVLLLGVAFVALLLRKLAASTPSAPTSLRVRRDVLAGCAALAIATPYWLPVLAASGGGFRAPQNLQFTSILRLLVLPTDVIDVYNGASWFSATSALPYGLESVPLIALLAWGLVGAFFAWRDKSDDLPLVGALFAVVIAGLVCAAKPLHLTLLGPLSWRFLYFVRLGCALAALVTLQRYSGRLTANLRRVAAVSLGFALMASSAFLWGKPLAAQVPQVDSDEMRDVETLWHWLAAHKLPGDRGRVFVQDTFMTGLTDAQLVRSHILALTFAHTGIEPLGPLYGIVPSTTAKFTRSEFGKLFGLRPDPATLSPALLRRRLAQFDVTRIVTAAVEAEACVVSAGVATEEQRIGRFVVFHVHPEPPGADTPVRAHEPTPGELELAVSATAQAPVTLSHAFHPFWEIARGPEQAFLAADDTGLLTIRGLPAGKYDLVLQYRHPAGTWAVSAAGWLAVWVLARVRRPRESVG